MHLRHCPIHQPPTRQLPSMNCRCRNLFDFFCFQYFSNKLKIMQLLKTIALAMPFFFLPQNLQNCPLQMACLLVYTFSILQFEAKSSPRRIPTCISIFVAEAGIVLRLTSSSLRVWIYIYSLYLYFTYVHKHIYVIFL